MGRATTNNWDTDYMLVISIHALRGEGDLSLQCVEKRQREDFNPRPPWGGRQNQGAVDASVKEFQSTPSVGRATATNLGLKNDRADFNPRPPWGGRLVFSLSVENCRDFNPRPPWGGRRKVTERGGGNERFQSTPSVGRATRCRRQRRQGVV